MDENIERSLSDRDSSSISQIVNDTPLAELFWNLDYSTILQKTYFMPSPYFAEQPFRAPYINIANIESLAKVLVAKPVLLNTGDLGYTGRIGEVDDVTTLIDIDNMVRFKTFLESYTSCKSEILKILPLKPQIYYPMVPCDKGNLKAASISLQGSHVEKRLQNTLHSK